jgi:hypothetical protein
MRQLLVAGLLYLIGISIVLTIKPSLMFTEDGMWKEFGIGRNPNTHSWMPFWLFAVLWALVCYISTTVLLNLFYPEANSVDVKRAPNRRTAIVDEIVSVDEDDFEPILPKLRKRKSAAAEMANGYYILNREATEAAGGIPKYIYLGKALPEDD